MIARRIGYTGRMSSAPSVTAQVGRGVATMLARYVVVTPLSFAASIVLARLLAPSDFGAYATVTVLVLGLGSLFELGVMSVLIQQPEEPTPREQRVVFTIYLVVFGALAISLALAAPWLAPWFKLPAGGDLMLRWMALQTVIGVIGCVPIAMLERRMQFGATAAIDIGVFLAEKGLTIALALAGHGVWSFVWAALVATALRMALLSACSPWPFGLAFDRGLAARYLARGAWFQGINLVTFGRDNLNTLVAGPLYGPGAVGLLNWALNMPTLIAGNALTIFQRVAFPAFARLHEQPAEREALLRVSMRRLSLLVFPLLVLLPTLGDPIVAHVYGEPWRAALPALAWWCLRQAAYCVYGPLIWWLNAAGRAKEGFRAMLAAALLETGLALALVPVWGFTGVAAGMGLGSLALAVVLWGSLRGEAELGAAWTLGPGLLLALPLGLAAAALAPSLSTLTLLLAALAALGGAWAAALVVIERAGIQAGLAAWRARRKPVEEVA